MNIEDIKRFIKLVKDQNLDSVGAIELLKTSSLTPIEKNIVYFYCFPRPLEDYGLPPRVQKHRLATGAVYGDETELPLIVEACRTEQYGRFMKHLMHAFGNPENIHPVAGNETDTCCICGRELRQISLTDIGVVGDRHSFSYGSVDSTSNICLDCLGRLIEVMELMEKVDPSFLNWAKRYQNALDNIKPI